MLHLHNTSRVNCPCTFVQEKIHPLSFRVTETNLNTRTPLEDETVSTRGLVDVGLLLIRNDGVKEGLPLLHSIVRLYPTGTLVEGLAVICPAKKYCSKAA